MINSQNPALDDFYADQYDDYLEEVKKMNHTEHKLKTIQPFFGDVKSGKKIFEIRLNDRNYQEGDTLLLMEWRNTGNVLEDGFTGQVLRKTVTYVLKDCPQFGLQEGYCILGIKDIYEPYSGDDSYFDEEFD